MMSWLIAAIAVIAVVLVKHSAADRWKRRFGAIGSPLMEPPAYRLLFLLVVLGVLLICLVPEAGFVLPALDAIGLDLVTILVVFELRHYLTFAGRRYLDVTRTNPVLWLYACMWALIWVRAFLGKDLPPPRI